jgi:hypothetical protein
VRLELRVHDLTGEDLRGELRLFGIDGSLVDSEERVVRADGRAVEWLPRIQRYGWYRASARILNSQGVVGLSVCDFCWLAPGGAADGTTRHRFGVVVPEREREELSLLPEMVAALGAGSVWFEVWGRADRIATETVLEGSWRDPWEPIATVVERLLESEREVTFVLDRAPADVAQRARVDGENPLRLMGSTESGWLDSLSPLITRFGERVRRWQVGAVGSDRAFYEDDVAATARSIHEALFKLIPRPIVVLAWGMAQSVGEAVDGGPDANAGGADGLTAASRPGRRTGWGRSRSRCHGRGGASARAAPRPPASSASGGRSPTSCRAGHSPASFRWRRACMC